MFTTPSIRQKSTSYLSPDGRQRLKQLFKDQQDIYDKTLDRFNMSKLLGDVPATLKNKASQELLKKIRQEIKNGDMSQQQRTFRNIKSGMQQEDVDKILRLLRLLYERKDYLEPLHDDVSITPSRMLVRSNDHKHELELYDDKVVVDKRPITRVSTLLKSLLEKLVKETRFLTKSDARLASSEILQIVHDRTKMPFLPDIGRLRSTNKSLRQNLLISDNPVKNAEEFLLTRGFPHQLIPHIRKDVLVCLLDHEKPFEKRTATRQQVHNKPPISWQWEYIPYRDYHRSLHDKQEWTRFHLDVCGTIKNLHTGASERAILNICSTSKGWCEIMLYVGEGDDKYLKYSRSAYTLYNSYYKDTKFIPLSHIGPEVADLLKEACKHEEEKNVIRFHLTSDIETRLDPRLTRPVICQFTIKQT